MSDNYVECIANHYPEIQVVCVGDPTIYENITLVVGSQIPPKTDLDIHILADFKNKRIDELSTSCQKQIRDGFHSSALGYDCIYDGEEVDQLNLLGAVSKTSPTSTSPDGTVSPYAVRPVTNANQNEPKIYVTHTYAQLRQVLDDGANYKLGLLQKFNIKRNYVLSLSDINAVSLVTWDSIEPA